MGGVGFPVAGADGILSVGSGGQGGGDADSGCRGSHRPASRGRGPPLLPVAGCVVVFHGFGFLHGRREIWVSGNRGSFIAPQPRHSGPLRQGGVFPPLDRGSPKSRLAAMDEIGTSPFAWRSSHGIGPASTRLKKLNSLVRKAKHSAAGSRRLECSRGEMPKPRHPSGSLHIRAERRGRQAGAVVEVALRHVRPAVADGGRLPDLGR